MDIQHLEERIQKLEENKIDTTMSSMVDVNVYRAVQRVLATTSLSIGSTRPRIPAVLELTSVNKGLLFPRMTSTQRDAIGGPIAGLVIFNTTTNVLNFHNGSVWGAV